MHKSKDQILLENIYDNIANPSTEPNPQSGENSDYERAENLLSDTLDRLGVYVDPSSEAYADAIRNLVATLQNSPEEDQETAEKLAMRLDEPETDNSGNEQLGPDLSNDEESPEEKIFQQQYESNTILNAYKKVLSEGKKKKKENNKFAICTASVGRKDEAKYKSCKEQVK